MTLLILIPFIISGIVLISFVYLYKKGQRQQQEYDKEYIDGLMSKYDDNLEKLKSEDLKESQIDTLVQFRRENSVQIYHYCFFNRTRRDDARIKRIIKLIEKRVEIENLMADAILAA